MSRITESDVLLYYLPLIKQECKNSYKGLEYEDRISEGALAFLQPIRTYRRCYGSFQIYAVDQLRKIMKNANSNAWSAKRLESKFSLDAQYSGSPKNGNFTLLNCIGKKDYDESEIDVELFIKYLTIQERDIVVLLLKGFNLPNIASILEIPKSQINEVLRSIKVKYKTYFDNKIN